ncbi:MAG: Gfo/Idh/MocA family oxidoreductase [Desulfobacteraceae bacterium]|nr:Gfo/Idh/MocA family oxidoreductase [Desulfobacteraceae bacterium]
MLNVGIVGCGLIGNKRAKVIKEDADSLLCCAADLNVFNAGGMLKQYGKGTAYRDWREMLDKETLDVVIAATPNKHLKKIVLWAAERKIHVLSEKPLGRNTWEAERMVKVAKENGVVLKTGFNHRFHPAIFRAHELVEDGSIGKPYFARCVYGHGGRPGYEKEWRASKEICGGGELLDQGVHVVDLFRWFMGDFEEAYGLIPTYYWDMKVEDNAFALFRTNNGRVASMHTSWTQWKNRFTFELFGEAGYLIVDGLGGSYGVETLTKGVRRKALGVRGSNSAPRYVGGVPDEERFVFDGPDLSWELEWKEFTAAIRENREPLGNGRDGLEANRMIEAVYRSARENRRVKMEDTIIGIDTVEAYEKTNKWALKVRGEE